MMADIELWTSLLWLVLPLLTLFFLNALKSSYKNLFPAKSTKLPRSLPIFGSYFSLIKNRRRINNWTADIVNSQTSSTFVLRRPLGQRTVITANPAVVQHILKTNFNNYQKGTFSTAILRDFLGNGIFNVDGPTWKFQRQISSHEFNTNSLRHFVQTVVDTELSHRLIPILTNPNQTLDFQDILQRFAFDNICKIAFGYDPAYLLPSLPDAKFAVAFETAVMVSSSRFVSVTPLFWKIRRFFQIGAEKELTKAIQIVREFASTVMKERKHELNHKTELQSVDLLSRFLSSGHSDEAFVTDIVISFILAGRDTTSAALTWFFYLIAKHPNVEEEIVREIAREQTREMSIYEQVKEMVYTHAALCETMRLYPPVPSDGKEVMGDDVLPEGTVVRQGNRVIYHPYAMGRSEKLWGPDWAEFRPERWLEREEGSGKWVFVGRDQYAYPVFQAGPRVCLGKEMAFLQMKRVVAGVLRRFRVVPAMEEGKDPVYISYLTSKMEGGFPVTIQQRPSLI